MLKKWARCPSEIAPMSCPAYLSGFHKDPCRHTAREEFTVKNGFFAYAKAKEGGAVLVHDTGKSVSITYCLFFQCSATTASGGGFNVKETTALTQLTLHHLCTDSCSAYDKGGNYFVWMTCVDGLADANMVTAVSGNSSVWCTHFGSYAWNMNNMNCTHNSVFKERIFDLHINDKSAIPATKFVSLNNLTGGDRWGIVLDSGSGEGAGHNVQYWNVRKLDIVQGLVFMSAKTTLTNCNFREVRADFLCFVRAEYVAQFLSCTADTTPNSLAKATWTNFKLTSGQTNALDNNQCMTMLFSLHIGHLKFKTDFFKVHLGLLTCRKR